MKKFDPTILTRCEIDLKAIRQNYRTLRTLLNRQYHKSFPRPLLMNVVKADAYGHGMKEVAETLAAAGCDFFGVCNVREGRQLRKFGIKTPILVFETTLPQTISDVITYRLTPTVFSRDYARTLNHLARKRRRRVDVHIKIDTGMARMGVWYADAMPLIEYVAKMSHLRIQGIYTHFPLADKNTSYTHTQIYHLENLVTALQLKGHRVPLLHAANSMGLSSYAASCLNVARPGLMIYGLYPDPRLQKTIKLKPAMTVRSRIVYVKDVPKGRGVSYGHTYVTERRTRVATIPAGYADGFLRAFSNKACVLIGGRRCPVIGNVTMDQMMVDVSALKRVRLGDEVVILGKQKKEEITAADLAGWADTINYEIVCLLGARIPRLWRS